MDDLLFTDARILTEKGVIEGYLAVKDGKIIAIGAESDRDAKRIVDIGGKLIAPSLVDLHVHFREPGFTQKEDFLTGTRAAAAGGVTTVVDEPNNSPVTNSLEAITRKRRIIEGKAFVDYTLQMAVYADGLDEIRKAREAGIIAFPVFDELGDRPTGMENTVVLYEALRRIKEVDGLALFNCRESDLVIKKMNRLRESGRNTLSDYMDHFPHEAESLGAEKRILLAHNVGVRAHLREVSTLARAREEKERGLDNIWNSPPGLPAIESMLPLLLTAVNQGRLGLERLFECASTNPAKVLGLYPRKGTIKVESDADLVVVDLEKESMIRGKDSKAKTHWTPYEDWKVKGAPVATYVRGMETYVDGEIVGEPGQGWFLSL